jgi:cyclophilin family peptidyl-prolyl cis-trans isomerase
MDASHSLLVLGLLFSFAGLAFSALPGPTTPVDEEDIFRVRFDVNTTVGPGHFTVKVRRYWAPYGAQRFAQLVKTRFYEDTRIFRVEEGFLQFGLSGDPKVQKAMGGRPIPDEKVQSKSNTRGAVVLAQDSREKNTRTTQIFINTSPNTRLDGLGFHTIGDIEGNGLAVLRKVYDCGNLPEEDSIKMGGNEYLDDFFPELSKITKVSFVTKKGKELEL